ncbi:hypothetical protein E2C01_003058 [Portunus trituberculatus]|uniref:Uncharacterized protein n=1 Tax=Portunus trituberculatus TaxID=210409 RepID=A0A5B7CSH6_PORTR|nr:hypothetical protein [Portunus trituberculatus]
MEWGCLPPARTGAVRLWQKKGKDIQAMLDIHREGVLVGLAIVHVPEREALWLVLLKRKFVCLHSAHHTTLGGIQQDGQVTQPAFPSWSELRAHRPILR